MSVIGAREFRTITMMIVIPERAIMSVWLSPLAANIAVSWFKEKVGWGSFPLTLAAVELKPSNRPNSTGYEGPPDCINIKFIALEHIRKKKKKKGDQEHDGLTSAITSLVAMARISAHETLFLHPGVASTAAFALITVSNPSPANDKLSEWSFSALLVAVEATITEASQPYRNKTLILS